MKFAIFLRQDYHVRYHIRQFFVPLASPNKWVYWECICKLFSVMDNQLSFGVERDVLVDELQYYFEQSNAADFSEEELTGTDSRSKANWMLRRLEHCGCPCSGSAVSKISTSRQRFRNKPRCPANDKVFDFLDIRVYNTGR